MRHSSVDYNKNDADTSISSCSVYHINESGATWWLGGIPPLIDLCHVRPSGEREHQDVSSFTFSYNFVSLHGCGRIKSIVRYMRCNLLKGIRRKVIKRLKKWFNNIPFFLFSYYFILSTNLLLISLGDTLGFLEGNLFGTIIIKKIVFTM